MDEENLTNPEQPEAAPEDRQKAKTPWQVQKECWYDKVPLTVKQLDIIIWVCLVLLGLIFAGVILDATGVWNVFN